MTNPFDYVKSINRHEYIMKDSMDEGAYNPYLTNLAFSFHEDTIYAANMINRNPELSHKMQYDFYYNIIKPRSRYHKYWPKKHPRHEKILLIMEKYKYNYTNARDIVDLIPDDELKE